MTSDIPLLLGDLHQLQGRITLDKRHVYRVDGKHAPGVTTLIKTMAAPQLEAWKVRVQVEGTARAAYLEPPMENESEDEYVGRLAAIAKEQFEHERISDEAADVGKQVHALIERAIKTDLGISVPRPEATDEALFIFSGWREWAQKVGLKPLMSEGRVYHAGLHYAGTFDILSTFERGKFAGKLAILDAKPNARIYPERRLQLAAYARPVRDMAGEDVLGMVVSMPRDGGEIEMVPVDITDDDFEAFEACLALYNWQRAVLKASRQAEKEVA